MVNIYGCVQIKNKQYFKVAEIEDILKVFPEISFENPQAFDGKWKKDENEIYYINLKDDLDIIQKFKDILDSSSDVNVIDKEHFPNLSFLFTGDKDYNIKFQRIYNKYFFKKSFLNFSDSSVCQINENQELITLTGKVDIYWNDAEKRLYFHDFRIAKSILPEIDKFYRTASDIEINKFSQIDILDVSQNDYGSRARQKIASMLDDNIFKDKTVDELREYAEKYNKSLNIVDGKIKLENNKDIELMYQVVNQLFYTTDLTNEKRRTNSSKPLD